MVYKFGNKNTRGRDGKQKITEQWPKIMKTLDSQIKTHGSVSCSPRKRDARKRSEYIDKNNKVSIFMHL